MILQEKIKHYSEFDRKKRVQLDADNDDRQFSFSNLRRTRSGNPLDFPILLPYYPNDKPKPSTNPKWGSCLLYIEGISVIVIVKNPKQSSGVARIKGSGSKNKFSFDDDYVSCPSKNVADKKGIEEQELK